MRFSPAPVGLVVLLLAALQLGHPAAASRPLAEDGDAYVRADPDGDAWTIGSSLVRLSVRLDPRSGLVVTDLSSPETGRCNGSSGPDTSVALGSDAVVLGTRALVFERADGSSYRGGARPDLSFVSRKPPAKITRTYVSYPSAPVIETWTTFEAPGSNELVTGDLSAFDLVVQPGTVRWVTGLDTPESEGGPFTLASRVLEPGEHLTIVSTGRSTERSLPWFFIDSGADGVFGALLWSGSWQLTLTRTEDAVRATLGLPSFMTRVEPGRALEGPHAVFGVTGGSVREVSEAMQRFVATGLRERRAFPALVTYNTWYAYGTHLDEDAVRREVDAAADLGVELFVLDAGWYPNNPDDPFDFTTGLGLWEADEERFPNGLRALRDHAHEKGLRFGLWVEPERVALDTVGRPSLARERWLATRDGRYFPSYPPDAPPSAQICLADAEARAWVVERLADLIEAVEPGYLKWDDSFWVDCNRAGHGHGKGDGNFAHVRGLYDLLAALREAYPHLLIENCSGGGRRLDLGLLAYTDVNWLDDRSAPSARVRHHLEGLSAVFPSPSLLSFVLDSDEEPLDPGPWLSVVMRSRMMGVLGMSWRSEDLGEGERETIRREIATYKQIRDLLQDASARLLTEQAGLWGGAEWDVVEFVSARTGDAVLFAFAPPEAPERLRVHLRDLRPDAVYEIVLVESGAIGKASGAALMTDGVEFTRSADRSAQLVVLRRTGGPSLPLRRSPSP